MHKANQSKLTNSSRQSVRDFVKSPHEREQLLSAQVEKKLSARYLKGTVSFESRMCDGVINERNDGTGNTEMDGVSSIMKLREKKEWIDESKLLGDYDGAITSEEMQPDQCAKNIRGSRRLRYEAASRLVRMVDSEGSKDLLLRLSKADKVRIFVVIFSIAADDET